MNSSHSSNIVLHPNREQITFSNRPRFIFVRRTNRRKAALEHLAETLELVDAHFSYTTFRLKAINMHNVSVTSLNSFSLLLSLRLYHNKSSTTFRYVDNKKIVNKRSWDERAINFLNDTVIQHWHYCYYQTKCCIISINIIFKRRRSDFIFILSFPKHTKSESTEP